MSYSLTSNISTRIEIGTPSILTISGPVTISAWVKIDDDVTSGTGHIFAVGGKGAADGSTFGYSLEFNGNQTPAQAKFYASSITTWTYGTTIGRSVWYHTAATADGTNQNIYFNGILQASAAGAGANGAATGGVTIGSLFIFAYGNHVGNGKISDFAIWNACLSGDEILSLRNGMPPYYIRGGSLRGYWPLRGAIAANDITPWHSNGTLNGSGGLPALSSDDPAEVLNSQRLYAPVIGPRPKKFWSGIDALGLKLHQPVVGGGITVFKRKNNTQVIPQGQLEVDTNHPMATNLIACWVPGTSFADLARGDPNMTLGWGSAPQGWGSTPEGSGPKHPFSTAADGLYTALLPSNALVLNSSKVSFYYRAYKYQGTYNSDCGFMTINSTTNPGGYTSFFRLGADAFHNLSIGWNNGGSFGGFNTTTTLPGGVVTYSVAASFDQSGNGVGYINGANIQSQAFGSPGPSFTAGQVQIGDDLNPAAGGQDGSITLIACIWNRILSDQEMLQMHLQPYAFIRPKLFLPRFDFQALSPVPAQVTPAGSGVFGPSIVGGM